jgi:hypothetical protein
MIDNFSLLLSHALVLIACWRLLSRPDLDSEDSPEKPDFPGARSQTGRTIPDA